MSVLIKELQMAPNCHSCQFCLEEDNMFEVSYKCDITEEYIEIDHGYRFPNDCPLIEIPRHHGRLIDAEFLKEHLYACATNGRPLHKMYQELDELLEAIDDIPTIIEAE